MEARWLLERNHSMYLAVLAGASMPEIAECWELAHAEVVKIIEGEVAEFMRLEQLAGARRAKNFQQWVAESAAARGVYSKD